MHLQKEKENIPLKVAELSQVTLINIICILRFEILQRRVVFYYMIELLTFLYYRGELLSGDTHSIFGYSFCCCGLKLKYKKGNDPWKAPYKEMDYFFQLL